MEKNAMVIAINAVSGGGKTTVTKELLKRRLASKAIYFDDRDYPGISGIDDIGKWEVEDGADYSMWELSLLENDLKAFLDEGLDLIILDYPFGYNQKQISPYVDLSIFVDTPLDICFSRRIIRDYGYESTENILSQCDWYIKRGREAYLLSVEAAKLDADVIIDGTLSLNEICDSILKEVVC